ncbi:hypothetical protein IJ182_02150 [bacterium]|nr:hypothetical protein [bacterium]
MLYKAIEIDEMFGMKDANHEIVDIMKNNGAYLKLVSLKKNEGFDSHMSNTNICIYLIDGELEIEFEESSLCGCDICSTISSEKQKDYDKKHKIKKGQMFLFEKDVIHTLKAVKDSTFLLVKI